jgi:hypothetical protein
MKTNVLGLTLALAVIIAGGVLATAGAATASKQQSTSTSHSYAMRMDACPYYPSPVACHANSYQVPGVHHFSKSAATAIGYWSVATT